MAQTFKFKTDLKCGGCIAKVKPQLDSTEGIISWSVDLANPGRLLTVELADNRTDKIVKILKDAGYTAELQD